MKNKKKIIFMFGILILIIIFLLFQINFIKSQELAEIEGISSQDFSYYGKGVQLIDNNLVCGTEKCTIEIRKGDITTTIEATQGIKYDPISGRISVAESSAEVSINGNSFKNIQSGEIILDQNTGKIFEAKFFTDSTGGIYNINGNEFNVPGDKEFIYPSKKGGFQLPGGTEVLEAQKNIQIETLENEIIKYRGNDITGNLNFDENGNAFVKIGEKAEINGVLIKNSGNKLYGPEANLLVFFNENSAIASRKTEYVVLDSSKNFFAFQEQTLGPKLANRDIKIEFAKDNYLFGDLMDEKDYVIIDEGGATPGYLEITRASLDNLPVVRNKKEGDIELWQDGSSFNFKDNNLIVSHLDSYKYPEGKIGTVPMILKTPEVFDSEGKKIKNGIIGFIAGEKDAKFKTFYFTSDTGEVRSLVAGGEYLKGDALAEEEYMNKWKKVSEVKYVDMEKMIEQANNPKFISSLKESKSADKYLTDIYSNKEIGLDEVISDKIGKEYEEFRNLQKQLEEGKINQEKFAEQVNFLKEKTGKEPSINWEEFGKRYGEKNAQNIKSAIKSKTESYYYAGDGGEEYLKRVLGPNELENLNECVDKEKNFDSCFDKYYTHYGLLTELCATSKEYCPVLTAFKFLSIGF